MLLQQITIKMEKELANTLKIEGNRQMKVGELKKAAEYYTEAIKLQRDPVFFCNRCNFCSVIIKY
jgi:hypothetical protein